MLVYNAEENTRIATELVLKIDPFLNGSELVTEVNLAGRLDAAEDYIGLRKMNV